MVKIGAELPCYPKNKTGYVFLDHSVQCVERFLKYVAEV